MKKTLLFTAILVLFAGCDSLNTKSVEHYKANKDEMKKTLEECKSKSLRDFEKDSNCVNARIALSELRNTIYTPVKQNKTVSDYIMK